MSPLDLCAANTVWCAVNVKSRKMAQIKTDCFTGFFEWKQQETRAIKTGLCSSVTRFNTDTRLKKQERHLLVLI